MRNPDTVSIRPGVKVLSVLRHLNYKPWFALAEFVDNSLQSYLDCRRDLQRVHGRGFKLKVAIRIENEDGGSIVIRDNAAGIHKQDYTRAFRAAEVPDDISGLCEFGMGMKSAACWFAPLWSVRTKALGEQHEKTVSFDIRRILRDSLEELDVETRGVDEDKHYTEVVLRKLYSKAPQRRTLGKIKAHLAGIYRLHTRDGLLELTLNGESLTYETPRVLKAPYHKSPSATRILWRKDIAMDLGRGRAVSGFAALRETGSTAEAGFALFRRKRLIQGSADEGYRPQQIFGTPNSYAYQRLFGELHLVGFNVSHTKDGVRWGEEEESFLAKLKDRLDAKPVPLLDQADGYRASPSRQLKKTDIQAVADRTANALEASAGPVLHRLGAQEPEGKPPTALPSRSAATRHSFSLRHRGQAWEVVLELSDDPAVGEWVELAEKPLSERRSGGERLRQLQIRFGLDHPFTRRFIGANQEGLESQLRIAAAIALAEVVARESGVSMAGTIKRNVNDLLRNALSKV